MVRWLSLLLLVLGAACASAAPGAQPAPPDDDVDDGFAQRETPQGEAAIELVVEPAEISLAAEERVKIYIVNRGEVEIQMGRHYRVQRWDGEEWVNVPWPPNAPFTDDALELLPGHSSDSGEPGAFVNRWPLYDVPDSPAQTPGWHRVVKDATSVGPDRVYRTTPETTLEARIRFLVTP